MESESEDTTTMKASFAAALKDFVSSPAKFRVLQSVPTTSKPQSSTTKTLYVLDSSFNPPSKAHMQIATSALKNDKGPKPHRLLLLLATQNADKASKPASFEDRLAMMTLFAQELERASAVPVDVAVTKLPYFHDKAAATDESGVYRGEPQQVHLTGFDTLIRIFDTKYYPPEHNFKVLAPFLGKHRLRVSYRTDDGWGGREEQEGYVKEIGEGGREREGAKREWADRIEMVEGGGNEEKVVSSTLARRAAKEEPGRLGEYVDEKVAEWIKKEGLYRE